MYTHVYVIYVTGAMPPARLPSPPSLLASPRPMRAHPAAFSALPWRRTLYIHTYIHKDIYICICVYVTGTSPPTRPPVPLSLLASPRPLRAHPATSSARPERHASLRPRPAARRAEG